MTSAAACVVLLVACSGGSGSANGSAGPSKVTDVRALPASYQIVYKVTTSSGSSQQQTWEVLTQTDPFDVSDLTYSTDPRSGAQPQSGTVSSFDHLYDLAGGRLTLVSDRQPGPGSGAQGIGVERSELVRQGLARDAGRSVVAGDSCDVIRFGEPPVGPIAPPNGSGEDDICIDGSGLEVHEAWTYHGRVVLERTALELRVGGLDTSLAGAPALSSARPSGAPAVLKVSEPPTGRSYLSAPPVPAGFSPNPAVSTVAFSPTDPTQVTDTSTIWSFSVGGAVLTVEAGQGQLPWAAGPAPVTAVQLKGLGQASLSLRSDGPEIRCQLDQDRWVRVRGTIPPAELSRYASELALAGA
jgi:hypothetical protein